MKKAKSTSFCGVIGSIGFPPADDAEHHGTKIPR
jgi:hypothetical protein